MSAPLQIAIDGPVGAGCSTVARLLAERLHFLYVDTGAMYRMAALLALKNDVDPQDGIAITRLLEKSSLDLKTPQGEEEDGRSITAILNGADVSWLIRTKQVNQLVPTVAAQPEVRRLLVEKQQKIAKRTNVVMEGRDITYRVLPKADLKIYLTASEVERAKRRHLQEQARGLDVSFEETYHHLLARDRQDKERAVDPLKKVKEAWVIDTTELSIDQVVDLIEARVKELQVR